MRHFDTRISQLLAIPEVAQLQMCGSVAGGCSRFLARWWLQPSLCPCAHGWPDPAQIPAH